MTWLEAVLLGALEGFTEFLPISSTGHLILATRWLGLAGDAVKTFTVVIQAGALAGILVLYRTEVAAMGRGALGKDPVGQSLLLKLGLSFVPVAVAGLLFHHVIKAQLFTPTPVTAALAVGGLLMIAVARRHPAVRRPEPTLDGVTVRDALVIGCAQCLALWPGTSRAMVTLVAGLLLGLPATVAAEYSFLLAVPTLGAATVFDALNGAHALLQEVGVTGLIGGFAAAAVVAVLAVRGFLRAVTRWGLEPFGWYRLGLAVLVWAFL